MATIIKRVRVANPRRRSTKRRVRLGRTKTGQFISRARTRARAKTKRRKSNRSVTRITRTKIVRRTNSRKRRVTRAPIMRQVRRKRHARRKPNPVLMELGMLNPKRRTNVARKASRRKSRRNPRRRRHASAVRRVRRVRRVNAGGRRRRRRSNPVTVVRYRRRRASNRVHHRRRRSNGGRRRNPSLFGRSGGKDLLMMTGGILVGVAATKYLPTIIPSSLTSSLGTSPIMGVVITGAGAFAAGWIAKKIGMSEDFSSAVLLGGLAQAASKLLNVIAPPQLSQALALSGMGDIMPGSYAVPQNPMRLPMIAAPAGQGGGGMGAFRRAFGGNR